MSTLYTNKDCCCLKLIRKHKTEFERESVNYLNERTIFREVIVSKIIFVKTCIRKVYSDPQSDFHRGKKKNLIDREITRLVIRESQS